MSLKFLKAFFFPTHIEGVLTKRQLRSVANNITYNDAEKLALAVGYLKKHGKILPPHNLAGNVYTATYQLGMECFGTKYAVNKILSYAPDHDIYDIAGEPHGDFDTLLLFLEQSVKQLLKWYEVNYE